MLSYKEFLTESTRGPLYHAIAQDRAADCLKGNYLEAHTSQVYQNDAIFQSPNMISKNQDRINHYIKNERWMIGISLTRSRQFASQWQEIIFEFDSDALRTRYQIFPFYFFTNKIDTKYAGLGAKIAQNYFSGISHRRKNKYNEYEEFLVVKKGLTAQELSRYRGTKIPNLHRYLTGIYTSTKNLHLHTHNMDLLKKEFPDTKLGYIMNHKLFKGPLWHTYSKEWNNLYV